MDDDSKIKLGRNLLALMQHASLVTFHRQADGKYSVSVSAPPRPGDLPPPGNDIDEERLPGLVEDLYLYYFRAQAGVPEGFAVSEAVRCVEILLSVLRTTGKVLVMRTGTGFHAIWYPLEGGQSRSPEGDSESPLEALVALENKIPSATTSSTQSTK